MFTERLCLSRSTAAIPIAMRNSIDLFGRGWSSQSESFSPAAGRPMRSCWRSWPPASNVQNTAPGAAAAGAVARAGAAGGRP